MAQTVHQNMKGKYMKLKLVIVLFVAFSSLYGQADDTSKPNKELPSLGWRFLFKSRIDFFLLQPNGFIYFDKGKDNNEKVDLYNDGNGSFNLQGLGGDMLWGESKIRGGFSAGVGLSLVSEQQSSVGSVVVVNGGFVLDINKKIRIETGYIIGFTTKESLKDKKDLAIYFGLSFPTTAGESIKKSLLD